MLNLAHARSSRFAPPPVVAAPVSDVPFVGGIAGHAADFTADEEIHGEGEPATYVYRVMSGAVRTFTMLADGRRQIEAFHFPGDVFGMDAEAVHRFSAEAVCDTRLQVIKRAQIESASRTDCRAAGELLLWTALALKKARAQMLLLGRKSAAEKVASFLLDMARSQPKGAALELPMSRSDIADYLGLTIETVSRTLSQLERDGAIFLLPSRRTIELRDQRRLAGLTA